MSSSTNNKYPADKGGTKYSEFRNTKRVSPGKVVAEKDAKQSGNSTDQAASKTTPTS